MTPIKTVLNLALLAVLAGPAAAAFTPQATAVPGSAPQGINYQGRLEDNNVPVNAVKTMVFRVFDVSSGGTPLWTSPSQLVSVNIGLFNAVVPVPITALVGGGSRYLEVQIDGTVMSPRELMNSVPYALIAKSVEGTIDASTSAFTINANSSSSQPALHVSSLTGNVGVGTGSPGTAFDVGGAAQFGSGAVKSTFTAGGTLIVPFAVNAGSANFTGGVTASSGTFTATGNTQFSVLASSGIALQNGGFHGSFLNGGTMLLTGTARIGGALVATGASHFGPNGFKSTFTAAGQLNVPVGIAAGTSTLATLPLNVVQLTGGSSIASFENPATGGFVTLTADGSMSNALNQTDGRYLLGANMVTGAGVTNHDYAGLAIGSSGLYSAITSGGSTLNGGVRELYLFTNNDFSAPKMFINAAGSTGLGTVNPGTRLDVNGTAQFGSTAKSTFTAAGQLQLASTLGVNRSGAPNAALHLSSGTLLIDGNAADSVRTAGRAGIGTANALTESLQVGGNLFMDSSGAGTTEIRGQRSTLSLANTADVSIRADSDNDTSGVIRFEKGTSGSPTEFARFDNNGRLGVGTSNPAAKLHMSSGTLIVDGNTATSLMIVGAVAIGTVAVPSGRLDVRSASGVEGALIARFTDTTPTPMVEIFASNDGTLENAANAVLKVKRAASNSRSINAAGSINASGADYAEWILWPKPHPSAGTVVRHKGTYMIVSSTKTAAFIGNDLYKEGDAILLTFMGQVPVKVRGKVKEGDYLIPNGDGTASAVSRDKVDFAQYREAVGVAWESSDDPGLKTVIGAVGVK